MYLHVCSNRCADVFMTIVCYFQTDRPSKRQKGDCGCCFSKTVFITTAKLLFKCVLMIFDFQDSAILVIPFLLA